MEESGSPGKKQRRDFLPWLKERTKKVIFFNILFSVITNRGRDAQVR